MNRSSDRSDDVLAVRLPRQQRSREAWDRILDAGVAIVEEGGHDAFTIAAVCERALVAPRAVYERVNTKDGLFLAVYERKIAVIEADRDELFDIARWRGRGPREAVAMAVAAMVDTFAQHSAFLRSVILISGVHPEIYRRGSVLARGLGERFAEVLRPSTSESHAVGRELALRMAFDVAFSGLVIRTSYGTTFLGPEIDDGVFVSQLSGLVANYLLVPEAE